SSTAAPAPRRRGETVTVLPRKTTEIERTNALSMRVRAGSDVSPSTRTPSTDTPCAIAGVRCAAGAAAHAAAAARTTAMTLRTKGTKLNHIWHRFPGIPSDPLRSLDCPMESGTWTIANCPRGDVRRLVDALGVSETTASVLVRRGYAAVDDARVFLEGAPPGHDPFRLGDMRAAVETLVAALDAGAR